MQKGKRSNRPLGAVLKIGFSLGLLAFILNQVGWERSWQALRGARPTYLAIALGLALLCILVRACRWKVLLDALAIQCELSRLTALYFVGTFFNTFLPTGVGGDVLRVYELAHDTKRPGEALGTVLVDRAAGILVLLAMALAALVFSHPLVSPRIAMAIVLLSVAAWGGSALVLKRHWLERLGLLRLLRRMRLVEGAYESVMACGPRAIAGALGVSLVLNVLLIAMNYLIAVSLGVRISLWYFLLFVPIISSLLLLPVSLSGLGVREGGYVYLFSQAGVPAHLALTMGLIVYAFSVATGAIGGLIYALEGVRGLHSAGRE